MAKRGAIGAVDGEQTSRNPNPSAPNTVGPLKKRHLPKKRYLPENSLSHSHSKRTRSSAGFSHMEANFWKNNLNETSEENVQTMEDHVQGYQSLGIVRADEDCLDIYPENASAGMAHARHRKPEMEKLPGNISKNQRNESSQTGISRPTCDEEHTTDNLKSTEQQILQDGELASEILEEQKSEEDLPEIGIIATKRGIERERETGNSMGTPKLDTKLILTQQMCPVLQVLSDQILRLLGDVSVRRSIVPFNSNPSPVTQESLIPMVSLFDQAKSYFAQTCGFLDESENAENDSSYKFFLWQVNVTTALCLLFASDRDHDAMNELHTRFTGLFYRGDVQLNDLQLDLVRDIKKEILINGVRAKRISRTDGLQNVSLQNDDERIVEKVNSHPTQILVELQAAINQPDRHFSYQERYGQQLQNFARRTMAEKLVQLQKDVHPKCVKTTSINEENPIEISHAAENSVTMRDSIQETGDRGNIIDHDNSFGGLHGISKPNPDILSINDDSQVLLPTGESAQPLTTALTLNEIGTATEPEDYSSSNVGAANVLARQYEPEHTTPSSTKDQYEKAKLATSARAAAKNKGLPLQPSQRRPWSPEEENALMTGLDRVQGPHWSQILAMYGYGGSISEILKDRNQIQLKDKARNLKLFFLKSGYDVPHYLKNVTGELKTRAPSQAIAGKEKDTQMVVGNGDSLAENSFESEKDESMEPEPAEGHKSELSLGNSTSPHAVADPNLGHSIPRGNRKEEEHDLSNAIQLALQAIQERNRTSQTVEEREEGSLENHEEQRQRRPTAHVVT